MINKISKLHGDFRTDRSDNTIISKKNADIIGIRFFQFYMHYIPVFWLLGIILPMAIFMLCKLSLLRWPRSILVNIVTMSWILIGVTQATASIFYGIYHYEPIRGLATTVSFSVIGWFFGALAIGIGAAYGLNGPIVIRSYTRVGLYILILAFISLIARLSGLESLSFFPPPLTFVLPDIPTVNFYMQTILYQTEETLGESTARLILFFPWATALGLAGLTITFISILEKNLLWKIIGVSGGLVATIFSFSRIALACLIINSIIMIFIKLTWFKKFLLIIISFILLFLGILNGFNPENIHTIIEKEANSARAGSSLARELIYEKSWEGFLSSPLLGNGWIGPSVHKKETLPIGSHSTIYGLAYTGGIFTLLAFVVSISLTLFALIIASCTQKLDEQQKNKSIIGIGLCLCLIMYSPYESLFNITISCLFMMTWIGSCLAHTRTVHLKLPTVLIKNSR